MKQKQGRCFGRPSEAAQNTHKKILFPPSSAAYPNLDKPIAGKQEKP